MKHYDIRFSVESEYGHSYGGPSLCDCLSCGQKMTTIARFSTRDPILQSYQRIFPYIPVLFCRDCRSADFEFQVRFTQDRWNIEYMDSSKITSEGYLELKERAVTLGPEITLDSKRKPRFTGFGAVSSDNYFMDIRGTLKDCHVCGKHLLPVLMIAQCDVARPTDDLMYVSETADIIFYPDANFLMVGVCCDCHVVGHETGPY